MYEWTKLESIQETNKILSLYENHSKIQLWREKTTTHMTAFSFPSIKDDQHMGKLVRVTIYPKVIVKCAIRDFIGERVAFWWKRFETDMKV